MPIQIVNDENELIECVKIDCNSTEFFLVAIGKPNDGTDIFECAKCKFQIQVEFKLEHSHKLLCK